MGVGVGMEDAVILTVHSNISKKILQLRVLVECWRNGYSTVLIDILLIIGPTHRQVHSGYSYKHMHGGCRTI